MNPSRRECLLALGTLLAMPSAGAFVRAAEAKLDVHLELVVPPKWKLPDAGKESELQIELHVTNRTAAELNFSVYDTLEPVLTTAAGDVVRSAYARKATRLVPPITIAAGKQGVVLLPVNLCWHDNATAMAITDPTAGVWSAPIAQGKYTLALHYRNADKIAPNGTALWVGEADAKGVSFEVG